MIDPDLDHSTRSCMTGDTIFPQLQAMRNWWWRAAEKGPAKTWRFDRFPVCFNKFFFGYHLDMTLITECIFRMWCHRCVGIVLGDEAASFVADVAALSAAICGFHRVGDSWRGPRIVPEGIGVLESTDLNIRCRLMGERNCGNRRMEGGAPASRRGCGQPAS